MENMKKKQTVGRSEPEFKFDIGTVVFIIIGFAVSWINMLVILDSMEIWSYLSIIFTSIIPGVLIAIKNRYWGYGYMFGFSGAGIPFLILIDLFIGGYTVVTALLIFIILWLIFWKAWRSLSSIKKTN
ncbi:MAG: hypothetical protein ACFFAQ_08760 [Promethearchaeota archaeon]